MRQGKGGAAGTTANGDPVTPKGNRKRAAPSAPSTGKSTASKRARTTTAKAVPPAQVIALDDDEDEENELPPIMETPFKGPRFTAAYEKQFYGTDPQTPALDTTQAETPNEDEEFKPHTPNDAAAFSFTQAPSSWVGGGSNAYNLDIDPISQPSFTHNYGYPSKATDLADDFDDAV